MFDDMYIPWTPRCRRKTATPPPEQPKAPQDLCPSTLHIARAVVAHAAAPFPEIAAAIASAFIAYARGQLAIVTQGPPTAWKAVPVEAT